MDLRHSLKIPLLMLVACSPVETWHQTGMSFAELNTDLTNCRIEALNRVPPSIQTRRTPVYFDPPRTYCYGTGSHRHCTTRSGGFRGGQVYTVDVNEDLRDAATTQCMNRAGYRSVELPRCTPDERASVATPVDRLGPLSENSCVTKTNADTFVAVTPN